MSARSLPGTPRRRRATAWSSSSSGPRQPAGSVASMRVPAGPDVTSSVPPSSSTRSRMPARPKPAPGAPASKPRPSSVTLEMQHAAVLPRLHRHARGARVLDGVVQRLLDDPVERRLHLGRAAALERELGRDLEPVARRGARGELLDRRAGPELVERRRAQLADQRAQALDLAVDRARRPPRARCASRRRRRDGARRRRACAGRRGPAASRRAARAPSGPARPRRRRPTRAAAAPRPSARWRPRSRRSPRTPAAAARPRSAGSPPTAASRPSERPRNASGTSTCASSPCPASSARTAVVVAGGEPRAAEAGEISPAVAATTSPALLGEQDDHPPAPTSARPRLTISSSTRSRSVSPPIARAIAVVASSRRTDASSSSRRVSEALVEPRVLDRDPRPLGEDHDRLLVGGGELLAARLLGQVEVAPGLAADQHRHAEEGRHRRVAGREAVGAGVAADAGEPQRARVVDQHAEDAAPARQVADRAPPLGIDPAGEEALELAALGVEDAERDVARARQVRRDRDQLLEQLVEVQLRHERAARLDQAAQSGGVERTGFHWAAC